MAVNQFFIIACQKKKIKKLEEEVEKLKEEVEHRKQIEGRLRRLLNYDG
jgi:ribosomal protein S13